MSGSSKRNTTIISRICIVLIVIILLFVPVVAFSMNSMSIVSSGGSYSSTSVGRTTAMGISQSSVTSVSAPPPQPQQAAAVPQTGMPDDPIPQQWVLDQKTGLFYDQISKATWVFDQYLNKFYSPTHGWFLITQYDTGSGRAVPVSQFYYDIKKGDVYDITTGTLMNPQIVAGTPGTQQVQQPAQSSGGWTITKQNPGSPATTTPQAQTTTGTQQGPKNPATTTTTKPVTTGTTATAASSPQGLTPEEKPWGAPYPTPAADESGLAPDEKPWDAAYYQLTAGDSSACGELEYNTDRPGNDYNAMTLVSPDPCECARICQEDESCIAFTYIIPGYEGNPDAQCLLKDAEGTPTPNDSCISGVMLR